nr:hypothetical protein [Tanacetum cinerariifolium]
MVQIVQGRQNRVQGNIARGNVAARNKGAYNRVGNANARQGKPIKCYNCNGIVQIEGNSDQCEAFYYVVDEAPTAQIMFMANLSSGALVYEEAGPSYGSDTLSEGIQIALIKEIKEMKEVFDQMETEVDEHAVDKKCDESKWKNLPFENENLIVECMSKDALESQNKDLTVKVNALKDLNERFRTENEKVKQHYKELYDSIKLTRAKTIEKTTSLLDEIKKLKAQLKNNMKWIIVPAKKPKVLAPGMYVIGVEPIPHRIWNYREVHLDYLKHLKETVATLREIVKEARVDKPLDSSLISAYCYTKYSQELLEYVIGVKGATSASGSKPRSNTKKDRTLPAKSALKKVEDHPRKKVKCEMKEPCSF